MALTKISSNVIANNTIAVGNIADNSVDATKIASNSILTRHIDDDQITTDQIAANTIATANIADNAVDGTKIASNSILTRHIDDNQIGIDQLNVSDGSNGQMLTTNGSGTLSFSTPSSFNADQAQVFNESGNDVDFRIESNDSANMFSLDAGNNKVLIEANNTASVTDASSMTAASAFEINGNASEGSDILRFFAMADGTGNYGMEVSNSAGNAHYDLMLNPINGGKVVIGDTVSSGVDDLLQIETPASGGGHGIQIRRNDSNTDQGIGRIIFGNNTDTDLVKIQATTDGNTDSGRITLETQATGGASTEKMRIDSDGMWRGELLNNDNTNPLGSGTNSGKLWSTSGNYINVWQVTNDAVGAHYWIEIDIQSLDGYTSYGEIYKDRNGRWRIVQHRQAGTNFQVSSDNNYIQVTQSSGANQTNSGGNLKLVRIPGATA